MTAAAILKHYRKIQARSRREVDTFWRQLLREDCPRDRYARWCVERAGAKLPAQYKVTYDRRIGSVDGIAIFYTGRAPGWREYHEYYGRRNRMRIKRAWSDDYEGEFLRIT